MTSLIDDPDHLSPLALAALAASKSGRLSARKQQRYAQGRAGVVPLDETTVQKFSEYVSACTGRDVDDIARKIYSWFPPQS